MSSIHGGKKAQSSGGTGEAELPSPLKKKVTIRKPSFSWKKRKSSQKSTDSSLSPAEDLSGDEGADGLDDDELVEMNPQEDPDFIDSLCLVHDSFRQTRSWKQLWRQSEPDAYRLSLNTSLNLVRSRQDPPLLKVTGPTPFQHEGFMNIHQSVEWRLQAREQLRGAGRYIPLSNIDLNGEQFIELDLQLVESLRSYEPKVTIYQPNWVA